MIGIRSQIPENPIPWAQAVVKLPFADVSRLAAAAQQDAPDERELTPVEEARPTPPCGYAWPQDVWHQHRPLK